MARKPCPECGTEISDEAESCPHCGHELTDDDSEPSPQPGCRSVGWALIFVLAIPIAVIYQWTRDPVEKSDVSGPDYACTQFIKSRMPNPSATQVRVETSDTVEDSRHRVGGAVSAGDTSRVPFTCVTMRREDGAWALVDLAIDSTATGN